MSDDHSWEVIVASTSQLTLGFLTVLQEGSGYLGGYLVTNTWGRPLEFRLSSAVQPTRLHQVLYAATLRPYICADLIGKTLVDRSAVPAQIIVTDTEAVLELRHKVDVPVVWVAGAEAVAGHHPVDVRVSKGPVLAHSHFAVDVPVVREALAPLEGLLDLAEPFARIREAVAEARKLGVASRAA
jgi:hypothetical protein